MYGLTGKQEQKKFAACKSLEQVQKVIEADEKLCAELGVGITRCLGKKINESLHAIAPALPEALQALIPEWPKKQKPVGKHSSDQVNRRAILDKEDIGYARK